LDLLRPGLGGVLVGAGVTIMVLGYEPAPEAPFPGSESRAQFVDASSGRDDVVIVTSSSIFSYAISTATPVRVEETPDHMVGFAPVYLDPHIKSVGEWAVAPGSPEDILAWTADADRVFVLSDGPLGTVGLDSVRNVLEPAGFRLLETKAFLWDAVAIFQR
jgi:hypothetical protein